MQSRISAWGIDNPIPVCVLFIVLMVAGIAGYQALPVKLLPDVSFPVVQVAVTLPGAAASEVEKQITREVEGAVSNISGVEHVQSTVSLGLSTTIVEFEIGEDPQRATDEVRAALDRIRNDLPRGIEEPIVERFDMDGRPILTYAVSAPTLSDVELSWVIDDTIAHRLITEDGVAQVTRVGGVDRDINVTLDPARLEALGLTAPAVNDALRSSSLDAAGGRAEIGGREQTVRVLGAAGTVEALQAMVLPTGDGRHVRLSDVATVAIGSAERRGFASLDGQPVVGFHVTKTKTASDVAVETNVARAIASLAADHPELEFRRIVSTAANTRASFSATVDALVHGMLLAAIVVFFFLRDWRATAIAAAAMPISLIPTFAVMNALGFSLNMITLQALTLVIGILVDDAIVEIENIQKRVHAGQTPYEAAREGADAIGLAVVATTLAIVVVFLPVAAMGGFAGKFFREFGLTVAVAVLFSLLVARLLTPLMAAHLMTPAAHPRARPPFRGFYRRALEAALAHRWVSIGVGISIFVGSLLLATTLPAGFTPPADDGLLQLSIEGAPGATLEDMRLATTELTQALKKRPEVDAVFTSIGTGSGDGDVRSGTVTVVLREDRALTTQQFEAATRPLLLRIPDVRFGLAKNAGEASAAVQIVLSSENGEALGRAALDLERQMRQLPELANVHQVTPRPGSELVIRLKPEEAARLGVTAEAVASIARVATLGDVDANTAKFDVDEQRIPIRVRLPDAARADLDVIGRLRVPTASGASVPLSAVAELSFQPGAARIDRFDRERRATIEAGLNDVSLGEALEKINALPILQDLPQGVAQPPYGQAEDMAELFGSFGGAMFAGVGMIFGVLVLLFRSFFKPVTILAALPLSLAGAFFGLLVFGGELNLPALIGLLMLMGLAAKNSILLVEFAIEAERSGVAQKQALLEACRERARPIVMTTLAMAAGMLPTALGLGPGSEMRAPMAIAVIGGLISSTLLSLVLVPVVYEFVDDFELWLTPKLARFVTSRQPERADSLSRATTDASLERAE